MPLTERASCLMLLVGLSVAPMLKITFPFYNCQRRHECDLLSWLFLFLLQLPRAVCSFVITHFVLWLQFSKSVNAYQATKVWNEKNVNLLLLLLLHVACRCWHSLFVDYLLFRCQCTAAAATLELDASGITWYSLLWSLLPANREKESCCLSLPWDSIKNAFELHEAPCWFH